MMKGRRAGRDGSGKSGDVSRGKLKGRYRLPPKVARSAQDVPCPARGKHGADCICGGSGTVKGIR